MMTMMVIMVLMVVMMMIGTGIASTPTPYCSGGKEETRTKRPPTPSLSHPPASCYSYAATMAGADMHCAHPVRHGRHKGTLKLFCP